MHIIKATDIDGRPIYLGVHTVVCLTEVPMSGRPHGTCVGMADGSNFYVIESCEWITEEANRK